MSDRSHICIPVEDSECVQVHVGHEDFEITTRAYAPTRTWQRHANQPLQRYFSPNQISVSKNRLFDLRTCVTLHLGSIPTRAGLLATQITGKLLIILFVVTEKRKRIPFSSQQNRTGQGSLHSKRLL